MRLKNKFFVNNVIKITYFCITKSKRKIFKFIGLCISISKKHSSFTIKNIFNGEEIELTFCLNSPSIFKIELLKNYNFLFKKSKLYFKKNTFLKQPPYNNKIIFKFDEPQVFFEPIKFILPPNSSIKDFKELKKKFRF